MIDLIHPIIIGVSGGVTLMASKSLSASAASLRNSAESRRSTVATYRSIEQETEAQINESAADHCDSLARTGSVFGFVALILAFTMFGVAAVMLGYEILMMLKG